MKKILVVDDIDMNREILRDVLFEYDVIGADSSQEGLELLEEHDFSLIILDDLMPDMSGFEFLEKIKGKVKTIPVIMTTSSSSEDTTRRAFELGAVDCITRPFNQATLKLRIGRFIEIYEELNELRDR